MNLPIYNPNTSCSKCGHKDIAHWYCAAGEWIDNASTRSGFADQNLIRSRCRNCNFAWSNTPLDSKQKEPIMLWRFVDAPKKLQEISEVGDEEWLVEIPPHLVGELLNIFDTTAFDARAETKKYIHPYKSGWKIKIGCH